VLIPLYSRFLSPAEYGAFALLIMILQGINYICLLGVDSATTRLYFSESADEAYRRELFSHAAMLLLIIPAIILPFAIPVGHLLTDALLDVDFIPYVLLTLLMALFTPIIQLMNSLLTIQGRAGWYGAFHLGYFLLQAATITITLVVFEAGLQGVVIAQLATSVVFGGIALLVLGAYSRPHFVRGLTVPLLKFGIPLLPSFACVWIDAAAGRFGLEAYSDLSAVGLFLLASQFAGIMGLMASSVQNALLPQFLREATGRDASTNLGTMVTRFLGLFTLLAIALMLFAPSMIVVISAPTYHGAALYVGPLSLAAFAYAARMPISWSLTHSNRPGTLSVVNGTASASLVVLLIIVLGKWQLGIPGVAYATIAVNLLALTVGGFIALRSFHLKLPFWRLAAMAGLLLACWALAPGNPETALEPRVLTGNALMLLLATGFVLWLLGLTNPRQLLQSKD
jgi:O-antigen/teichoic acid export membrane protein